MSSGNKGGRPTKYSIELAELICTRLANGDSLLQICERESEIDPNFPDRATIYRWIDEHEPFRDMYKHARDKQADSLLDECRKIADDATTDTIIKIGKDGREYETVDHEHINRSRLRVETRLKMIEKLAPRKYGTKLELSGDQNAPLSINIVKFGDTDPK